MRILYLIGGNDIIAGGATVRDATLVRGLIAAGHDVEAISLYGPAWAEGENGYSAIFRCMGKNPVTRMFPRLLDIPRAILSVFNRPYPVVNLTSLAVLGKRFDSRGPMAVSLLSASNKRQRNQFLLLMEHLSRRPGKVDVAILSNAMLSGLAEAIRGNLGCPIISLTQGSDRIIESLDEPYRSDARKLVRKNARLFRLVVSTSRFFAIRATEFLSLPPSRVRVVPPGVETDGRTADSGFRRRQPFTIGYMAPISKDRGLDVLVEAVDSLARDGKVDPLLWIAGRVDDERYWLRQLRRLDSPALKQRYKYWGDLAGGAKREFMGGLSVFVVPAYEPESRATNILEAMTHGVPVVGPAAGILPEIFQHANGGLLVSSDAPAWMFSQALELLASMPDTADEMGLAGAKGVREHFSVHNSAASLVAIIEQAIAMGKEGCDESRRIARAHQA